ncbi:N-acetylglucosamine-6-phosphate deacetylase [Butyrivibrio sp. INlla21]|uniref:N-acetylglucosamine-6-phosphate deacetylase n=1 Tax=Butyrivibrio sp. INlla21 TaxID=1520811 RepID=UPI0008EEC960|nr:N-acetylglucosamine-6-phosphate deacetylase [Butyrivibrio sp. INlla21]SFU78313.1 N-acetylglucosamine-6-phosphate deacetylase [Butyrivibrio sp. INlla21]
MIIKNAAVFTEEGSFESKDIFIDGTKFVENASGESVDASGCYAIPGLVDIHTHGCNGVDFSDGELSTLEKILDYEVRQGVTTLTPTTMTLSEEDLTKVMKNAASYKKTQEDGKRAYFQGINMEGPFISEKKCGAQNTKYIRKPDIDMFNRLFEVSEGCIMLCDIAPEEDTPSMDFINEISKKCRISIAHTDADYDIAKRAIDAGARHMTHLYNAMAPLHHRNPGPIAAAAEDGDVVAELICDGIHVAAPMVRATFKLFGKERVALISDSMMATGLADGEYELGKQPVTVRGNEAKLHDGTIAGSVTNLMGCLKHAVLNVGIPIEDAVYSATVTPAKAVRCYEFTGSFTPGKFADLVLIDKKTFEVKAVFARGNKII